MFATIRFETTPEGHYHELKIALTCRDFLSAVAEANACCHGYSGGRKLKAQVQAVTSNRPKGEVVNISELDKVEW